MHAPNYSKAQKKQPRWIPPRDEGNTAIITSWIRQHAPASVTVQCDDCTGRWRVISPSLDFKSISLSKRGYEIAALEVIHQAWSYYRDYTGREAPFNRDELATRWQADVAMA